jgi:hypothetical protein
MRDRGNDEEEFEMGVRTSRGFVRPGDPHLNRDPLTTKARVAGFLVSAVLLAGSMLSVGVARPAGACDTDVCGPPPQVLFAQLNSDITAFPPVPLMPVMLRKALDAEDAFPPSPIVPSDFCSAYGQFGALDSFVAAQANQPDVPASSANVILGDIATIRTAPIWSLPALPPSPCING